MTKFATIVVMLMTPSRSTRERAVAVISTVVTGVCGELLQLLQPSVDSGSAGEVGVEGGELSVQRGLRDVVDDESMNALFHQKAKPYCDALRITI